MFFIKYKTVVLTNESAIVKRDPPFIDNDMISSPLLGVILFTLIAFLAV